MTVLGLLTCSKQKLPVPAPAWLLYSASPRFSQQYQSLVKEGCEVLILSAKYGPVNPLDVLKPYDLLVTQLDSREFVEWIRSCDQEIRRRKPTRVLSYLTKAYSKVIPLGIPSKTLEGNMYQRATQIASQGKLARGKQVVCWPINWVLSLVHEERPTLSQLQRKLSERGYAIPTVKAQLLRARICPLHQLSSDGHLENKYSSLVKG